MFVWLELAYPDRTEPLTVAVVDARGARRAALLELLESRAERARGAAPPGPPARDLAIALTSMNERVIYGSLSGDGPALADADVVPVLLRVWLAAVYGDEPY